MQQWVLDAGFALLAVDFVVLIIWINKREARKRAELGRECADEVWAEPPKINPSTGLSMVSDTVDSGGNLYGECFTDDDRLDPFESDGW
ncbi:MAG: hypothetical protein ACYCV6_01650 [Steroidobacteraceae bacterium]|jgi:hypothetical protein